MEKENLVIWILGNEATKSNEQVKTLRKGGAKFIPTKDLQFTGEDGLYVNHDPVDKKALPKYALLDAKSCDATVEKRINRYFEGQGIRVTENADYLVKLAGAKKYDNLKKPVFKAKNVATIEQQ